MGGVRYNYSQVKIIREKYLEILQITKELEKECQGRHFTMDGHLVGSIGEVVASYHYGIELDGESSPIHDGVSEDGTKVQIKIVQQDCVVISGEPKALIVLYLTQKGDVYEVYNGPGKTPWEKATRRPNYACRYMRVNNLMKLDADIEEDMRIKARHPIEKMKPEYKNNSRKAKKGQAQELEENNLSKLNMQVGELARRTCEWWNAVFVQYRRFCEALTKKQTVNPWMEKGVFDTLPTERHYLIVALYHSIKYLRELKEFDSSFCNEIEMVLQEVYQVATWDKIRDLRDMNEHFEYVVDKGKKQNKFGRYLTIEDEQFPMTAAWTMNHEGKLFLGQVEISKLIPKMEANWEEIRRITREIYHKREQVPRSFLE